MANQALSTRRVFLGGVAALAPVLAVPAVALASSEPELAAAIKAYEATVHAHEVIAMDAVEAAWARYREMGGHPEMPGVLLYREDEDDTLGLTGLSTYVDDSRERAYRDSAIAFLRNTPRTHRHEVPGKLEVRRTPWPESQARADEIVAAWDAWEEEKRRRSAESGIGKADQAENDAYDRRVEAEEALARIPARSVEGLMKKAALIAAIFEGDHADFLDAALQNATTTDERIAASITHDLMMMSSAA